MKISSVVSASPSERGFNMASGKLLNYNSTGRICGLVQYVSSLDVIGLAQYLNGL
jgi:hypothetical protein